MHLPASPSGAGSPKMPASSAGYIPNALRPPDTTLHHASNAAIVQMSSKHDVAAGERRQRDLPPAEKGALVRVLRGTHWTAELLNLALPCCQAPHVSHLAANIHQMLQYLSAQAGSNRQEAPLRKQPGAVPCCLDQVTLATGVNHQINSSTSCMASAADNFCWMSLIEIRPRCHAHPLAELRRCNWRKAGNAPVCVLRRPSAYAAGGTDRVSQTQMSCCCCRASSTGWMRVMVQISSCQTCRGRSWRPRRCT
jgi:hypothetical protein